MPDGIQPDLRMMQTLRRILRQVQHCTCALNVQLELLAVILVWCQMMPSGNTGAYSEWDRRMGGGLKREGGRQGERERERDT